MSLIGTMARAFLPRLATRAAVLPSSPIESETGWWSELTPGGSRAAKKLVTPTEAMTLPVFNLCTSAISADVAKVPVHLYRKAGQTRSVVDNHPASNLLLKRPNPWMEAFNFRENGQASCLHFGNFYGEIERDAAGKPLWIWPLRADCVDVKIVKDKAGKDAVKYRVNRSGGDGAIVLDAADVFHVRGLGNGGLKGLSMIRHMAETLDAALNLNRSAANALSKGGVPRGVLTHPKALSKRARENLRGSWEEMYAGADPKHRVAILEEGLTFAPISMAAKDLQLLESRQWSVIEFCQFFRLPPHKAFELSRAHFNNVEAQELAYGTDTLLPWWIRWEQQAWAKLLSESEQAEYYFKHQANALLRAEFKARTEGYASALQNGWMNRDEVRALEDLNPIADGSGAMYTIQVNQQSTKAIAKNADKPADNPGDAAIADPAAEPAKRAAAAERAQDKPVDIRTIAASLAGVLEAAARSLLGRESDQARKRFGQPADWADEWYGQQESRIASAFLPTAMSLGRMAEAMGYAPAAQDINNAIYSLASSHVARSKKDLAESRTGWWAAGENDRASSDGKALADELGEIAQTWARGTK